MWTKKTILSHLERNYTLPGHAVSFSNVDTIWRYYDKKISRAEIEKILQKIDSYTLHRKVKKQKTFTPIFARTLREQLQLDLFEFHDQQKYNDCRYILLMIDQFSKFIWVKALQNKSGKEVTAAVKQLLKYHIGNIDKLIVDAGKEFFNKHFKDLCDQRKIRLILPRTSGKALVAERAISAIKGLISKYMTSYQTRYFLDVLPQIILGYNKRFHRSIQDSPINIEMNEQARIALRGRLGDRYQKLKSRKPLFDIYTLVRIHKARSKLHRGFNEHFSEELFIIQGIDISLGNPLYTLSNLFENEYIVGAFRSNEITRVYLSLSSHVRSVIREEGEFLHVNFKSLPRRYKARIHKKNIAD